MENQALLQRAIDCFWDSVPSTWGRVRNNVRTNAIKDLGITLIQFHLLRHIRQGAHSTAELAERQQISRPAISQAVDQLVEKGLVVRATNPGDRRYVHLDLTEEGAVMMNAVFQKNRQWMGERMSSLSSDDLQSLIVAMEILKKAFEPE